MAPYILPYNNIIKFFLLLVKNGKISKEFTRIMCPNSSNKSILDNEDNAIYKEPYLII